MLPKQVCATSLRLSVLRYALELATALRIPLVVALATRHANTLLYLESFRKTENELTERVRQAIQKLLGMSDGKMSHVEFAGYDGTASDLNKIFPEAILVSDDIRSVSDKSTVVDPFSEEHLFRSGMKNILIPLGNDPTSVYTFKAGLEIAKKFLQEDGKVVFYHTTWRNPEIHPDDPSMHVCPEAKEILAQAKYATESVNAAAEVVIETAPSVVEGIALAAFRHNAGLVIIARDKSVRFGDYCEQLYDLMRGSIPVLILPDSKGEKR